MSDSVLSVSIFSELEQLENTPNNIVHIGNSNDDVILSAKINGGKQPFIYKWIVFRNGVPLTINNSSAPVVSFKMIGKAIFEVILKISDSNNQMCTSGVYLFSADKPTDNMDLTGGTHRVYIGDYLFHPKIYQEHKHSNLPITLRYTWASSTKISPKNISPELPVPLKKPIIDKPKQNIMNPSPEIKKNVKEIKNDPITDIIIDDQPLISNVNNTRKLTVIGGRAPFTFSLIKNIPSITLLFKNDEMIINANLHGVIELQINVVDSINNSFNKKLNVTFCKPVKIDLDNKFIKLNLDSIHTIKPKLSFGFPPYKFEWIKSGPIDIVNHDNYAEVITKDSGNAVVRVKVIDSFGYKDETTMNLQILSNKIIPPKIKISVNKNQFNIGEKIICTANIENSSDIWHYEWKCEPVNLQSKNFVMNVRKNISDLVINDAGTYNINVTAKNKKSGPTLSNIINGIITIIVKEPLFVSKPTIILDDMNTTDGLSYACNSKNVVVSFNVVIKGNIDNPSFIAKLGDKQIKTGSLKKKENHVYTAVPFYLPIINKLMPFTLEICDGNNVLNKSKVNVIFDPEN